MIRDRMKATCVVIASLAAVGDPTMAQFTDIDPALYVAGEILVSSPTVEKVAVVQDRLEVAVDGMPVEVESLSPQSGIFRLVIDGKLDPQDSGKVRDVLDISLEDGLIGWAEPVLYMKSIGGQTGSLWVSGPDIDADAYENQYGFQLLGLSETHPKTSGRGTLVAVLDTGIDPRHEAVFGRVSPFGASFVEGFSSSIDSPDLTVGADNNLWGHGTFVAGLVSLVAPDAGLLPVRVLDPAGIGTIDDVIVGIDFAIESNAHVIVLACGTQSPQVSSMNAVINRAIESGITVVAAAGNGGTLGCYYPASFTSTIAVGASDHQDLFEGVSSWCEGIDATAPGSMVVTGGFADADRSVIGPVPGVGGASEYKAGRGTSFSTAMVAGVAALVRAQHADWPDSTTARSDIPVEISARLGLSTVMVDLPSNVGARVRISGIDAVSVGSSAPVPGDCNGDGCVDAGDVGLLLGSWSSMPGDGSLHLVDVDGDFSVGASDLGVILGSWSSCP